MRVELGTTGSTTDQLLVAPPRAGRGIDRREWLVLIAFGAVSLWVIALDLWQVAVTGRVWTGTDGLYIVDQLQYLSWIRSASQHLLAANLFVLRPTPADYFQPAVAISGGLSALGLSPWLSLLLWKPVAVAGTFFAVRAYVRRTVFGRDARFAALVLALFFGSFTIIYGSVGAIGDLFPGFLSWGYTFGLMALAAMVASLLAYDRVRLGAPTVWLPGLFGAIASSLHPWHGELLIVTVIGAEVIMWRRMTRRRLVLPVVTLALTGLPLLYYMLLGQLDLSWHLAREASHHQFSLLSILLAIAPLLVVSVGAYRRRPATFLAASTLSWPLAALAVFVLSASGLSATPLHAFQGITIPLAVLAVRGVQRIHWREARVYRVITVAAVVLFTVPTTVYQLSYARDTAAPTTGNANFITRDEHEALAYLARDRTPGGVLSQSYLGAAVPARTGRRTFVGDCLWSEPDCYARSRLARALFKGSMTTPQARRFVRHTGARFLLADCGTTANMLRILAPILGSVQRFGCAAVYELSAPGLPTGPVGP